MAAPLVTIEYLSLDAARCLLHQVAADVASGVEEFIAGWKGHLNFLSDVGAHGDIVEVSAVNPGDSRLLRGSIILDGHVELNFSGTRAEVTWGARGHVGHAIASELASRCRRLAVLSERQIIVTRRLPLPGLSNGVIAEYAETPSFGARVIMHYQPYVMSQQYTVDVLYGLGVLKWL